MKIGISQPTFLPWCGYIALIDHVDEFIFLDDVQFEKRGWQQRNYIKLNNSKHLLTVPVITKGKRDQKIHETEINNASNFAYKHLNTLKQAYSNSKYFKDYSFRIFEIYKKNYKNIINLNIDLINYFCETLDINTKFDFSSKLNIETSGIDRIIQICKKKKCTQYISTIGSKDYIFDNNLFLSNQMSLNFYEFSYKNYNQLGDNFLPNLSFIDILFNLGNDSIHYLRNNLKIINEQKKI